MNVDVRRRIVISVYITTQTSPTQTSPTQTSPYQTSPTQTSPTQTSPNQASPNQTSPTHIPRQFGISRSLKRRGLRHIL